MEELVQRLAELQTFRDEIVAHVHDESIDIEMQIDALETDILTLKDKLELVQRPFDASMTNVDRDIERVSNQIVDAWDGEKKTLEFDAGTLKFLMTQSLEINSKSKMMYVLSDTLSLGEIANKYITGYNKTVIKKYMGVHSVTPDVAELIPKTTVELEQESG